MSRPGEGGSYNKRRRRFVREETRPEGFWVCSYCESIIEDFERVTVDHYIPLYYIDIVRGMGRKNWRIACENCNCKEKNTLHSRIVNLFKLRFDDLQYPERRIIIESEYIEKLGNAFIDIGVLYGRNTSTT